MIYFSCLWPCPAFTSYRWSSLLRSLWSRPPLGRLRVGGLWRAAPQIIRMILFFPAFCRLAICRLLFSRSPWAHGPWPLAAFALTASLGPAGRRCLSGGAANNSDDFIFSGSWLCPAFISSLGCLGLWRAGPQMNRILLFFRLFAVRHLVVSAVAGLPDRAGLGLRLPLL